MEGKGRGTVKGGGKKREKRKEGGGRREGTGKQRVSRERGWNG